MAIPTYSFRNVHAGWGGIPIIDIADEGIVVTPNDPTISRTNVSIDGMSNVAMSTDYTGTIAVNLNPQSRTNLYLGALLGKIRSGAIDNPTANFVLSDPSGIVPAILRNVYLDSQPASYTLDLEAKNTQTWTFRAKEMLMTNELDMLPEDEILKFQEETENQINIFLALQASF